MYYGFELEDQERYIIVRDYYVSNPKEKGIYFVTKHEENGQIQFTFLGSDQLNDEYEPVKCKSGNARVCASALEHGKEDVLIIEHGKWKKKTFWQKEVWVPAKRYRYILKEK
ncbi:hypothetical protein IMZ31_23170 (plasmid) [Pontibacillus sp. ALD_SL1]|uniref:hypothetical protein n=1 Tax=Pontibacillus sp. ALD_SL1 TaxID=2777185 RepID=UPI001A979A44|nr:hypothetical protein [Pontibacillus sp. ALD_SL1]QST02355.1 hypothetical protein IMZ31_23170 [Pontibacillus sp. ALD_SL1]